MAKTLKGFTPRTIVRIEGKDFSMNVQFCALESVAFASMPLDPAHISALSDEDWIERYVRPTAIAARNKWRSMETARTAKLFKPSPKIAKAYKKGLRKKT